MRNALSIVAVLFAISLTACSTSSSGMASSDFSAHILKYSYTLTPELFVEIIVSGPAENTAQIDFYDGSLLLDSLTLTQASPHGVIPQAMTLGRASIDSGATLDLTIPSAIQAGQVFLQAKYQSPNIPSTTISAAIATWSSGQPSS